MDYETEIQDLKRRVGDLEGAVNVLAGKLGKVHPELVALSHVTERRFAGVEGLIGKVVSRLDTMNTQVWSLRDELPGMVGEAVHRALAESK